MITQSPFLLIAFAALLHASFQLGVSVLTMLSGHGLGLGRSFARLMRLNIAYVSGALCISVLLFAGVYYLTLLLVPVSPVSLWGVATVLNSLIGLMVVLFYFRRTPKGTGLWIPRTMAEYLTTRTKKTKHTGEAFTLGAGCVLAEFPFIIGPLFTAVLYSLYSDTPYHLQITHLLLYVGISIAPLLIIVGMVGAGHKLSTIQQWREQNKRFLQYCAGSGLMLLGIYIYVDKVIDGGRGI